MKGFLKTLSPFAPDQSGAVGALYELGGVIVICDAGGCAGNICGFDEPRWRTKKSAVFSAGLRDMDAVFGRDDQLIEKLKKAVHGDAAFTSVIGTPVPAVIGTDLRALDRLSERATGLPGVNVDTDGTALYDEGQRKAYKRLFDVFAADKFPVEKGRVGLVGVTPLEVSRLDADQKAKAVYGEGAFCAGFGSGLEEVRRMSANEYNVAVGPSAVEACELLRARFGTPYQKEYPFLPDGFDVPGANRTLIVAGQYAAEAIRARCAGETRVASWFRMDRALTKPGDARLETEDDFIAFVRDFMPDVIVGDAYLKRAVPDFTGAWADLPQLAVSGRLID